MRVRQAVRQSERLRVRQAVRQSERLVVVLDRLVLQGLQGFRCCTPEASQATIDQHGLEAAACVRLDDVLGGPGRYAYVERLRTLGVRRLPVVRCAFAVCRRYGSVVVGVAGVPGFRGGFSPTASSYCLSACASVVAFGRPECSDRSARSCCARLHGRPGVFRGGPPEGALLEPQHLLAYEFLDLPPRTCAPAARGRRSARGLARRPAARRQDPGRVSRQPARGRPRAGDRRHRGGRRSARRPRCRQKPAGRPADPAGHREFPPEPPQPQEPQPAAASRGLTAEECDRVLAACCRPRRTGRGVERDELAVRRGLVDGAVVALVFHGALRRGEVAALRWADVDLSAGDDIVVVVVTVPGSKTNPAEDGAGGRQSGRRLRRRAPRAACGDEAGASRFGHGPRGAPDQPPVRGRLRPGRPRRAQDAARRPRRTRGRAHRPRGQHPRCAARRRMEKCRHGRPLRGPRRHQRRRREPVHAGTRRRQTGRPTARLAPRSGALRGTRTAEGLSLQVQRLVTIRFGGGADCCR